MSAYYMKCGDSYRGRPITALPTVLNKDLQLLENETRLKNEKDLQQLRSIASDRTRWREIKHELVEAANMSLSLDRDAKGP